MCKSYNITFFDRIKFLFSGNINDIKTKGYYLTWHRDQMPKSLKNKVFARDVYVCKYCNHLFPVAELTIDHYIPFSVVKEHKEENLVTSCQDCNSAKGHINPNDPEHKEDWDNFMKRKIEPRKSSVVLTELLFELEKEFINKEYTFETLITQVHKLYKNKPHDSKKITFRKPTNNIIKNEHKDFWLMTKQGSFSIDSIELYLGIKKQKLRLVA